jgi:hypothetical protein
VFSHVCGSKDAEKLCKLVKSSKTLRDVSIVALGNLLAGLGDSSRLVHEAIAKAFKAALPSADRVAKGLLARSLCELGRAAGSAVVLEGVWESLLRLMEDADGGVYAEAQDAMGKLLGISLRDAVREATIRSPARRQPL